MGFAAIANDRQPTPHTLIEVIAIADGINHDLLTEGEFCQTIGRLLAADLIGADADADLYWLTQAGSKLPQGRFGRAVRDYLARWPDRAP
jgi:hypothetical protein